MSPLSGCQISVFACEKGCTGDCRRLPDTGFPEMRGAGAQTGKSKSSGRASRQSLAFDVSFRIVYTGGFDGFRKPGLDFNEF
jgi:hypothetical protein